MVPRPVIASMCMLCTLVTIAQASTDAAPAASGRTSFTCAQVEGAVGTQGFKDEHCQEAVVNTASQPNIVKFEHTAITAETATTAAATNAKAGSGTEAIPPEGKFAEIIGGMETEFVALEITGSGTLENLVDPTGESYTFAEGTLTFSTITLTKPAGKGCILRAKKEGEIGMVTTQKLRATSTGQGDRVKVASAEATPFATFWVECVTKVPAVEGVWEVTGSLTCPTEGATLACTHADVTTQGTFKGKALKVMGIECKLTITAKDKDIVGDVYRPISVTTVSTP
jgi:hypothetical protein